VMAQDLYDDAIIDVAGPNTMLSAPYTIKVSIIHLPPQLLLMSYRTYFSMK
jgi:hypothetical protein